MTDGLIDVSIIIVNYNVRYFAEQCIRSVIDASTGLNVEIILVDNQSTDGSLEYLKPRFPDLSYIDNDENVGFARANNQALRMSRGRYLLILNPDTLIAKDTLTSLIEYMEGHPKVGAAGPRIMTRDGSFDITSKRGLPTPWVAFCKLSGLAKLFPYSKLFGRYNLLYLDSDKPARIDVLVGSCMMVRRETYAEVGGFDEDYFMYGEDIDWCYRISLAGWEIHYAPVTSIIHFRGESTRRSEIDSTRAFYGAMHLFVDKHFRKKSPLVAHWSISIGIALAGVVSRLSKLWQRGSWVMFDWAIIAAIIIFARWLRWGDVGITWGVSLTIIFQATIMSACLFVFNIYGRNRGLLKPMIYGLALGFLANSSLTYFFKQYAYSRFVNLFGLLVGSLLIVASRQAVRLLTSTNAWKRLYQRRSLIVGVGDTSQALITRLKENSESHYIPIGLIDPGESAVGTIIEGLPVLGNESELEEIALQEEIEEILFAYDVPDYDRVLRVVGKMGRRLSMDFKVISPEIMKGMDNLSPLLSLEYLTPRKFGDSLKMFSTIVKRRQ